MMILVYYYFFDVKVQVELFNPEIKFSGKHYQWTVLFYLWIMWYKLASAKMYFVRCSRPQLTNINMNTASDTPNLFYVYKHVCDYLRTVRNCQQQAVGKVQRSSRFVIRVICIHIFSICHTYFPLPQASAFIPVVVFILVVVGLFWCSRQVMTCPR